ALRNLGPLEAVRCVLSYVWVRIRPPKNMDSFEGWTASRFGWRLYRTFFKTYTEKLWGVPATEIKADWAAQRIKNLSLATALLKAMDPPPPAGVLAAADGLAYRDFITVALVVPEAAGFPDNWIYVHSPDVKLGRIQNFGSWSPHLVKDGRTCLGLEYFVFEGDHLWVMPDDELVELGARELQAIGLIEPGQVEAGYVVRMPKAYPMYDDAYAANVEVLRNWLAGTAPNVWPVGRNGMHKYNNQDHSMYTAMLAVENIMGAHHDIWSVNVEAEYHEQKAAEGPENAGTGRDAPVLSREVVDAAREARKPTDV